MDPTPAITSGNAGPIKFEMAHCKNAKESPETIMAGKTSFVFFNPHINTTR